MSQGWISLDRSIRENFLWAIKPFSAAQAWIDLLLLANHKDGCVMSGTIMVPVKRGQLLTTFRSLSSSWGWGHGRIESFLSLLESDKMIGIKKTPRGTIITIVNYEKFQKIPGETDGTH